MKSCLTFFAGDYAPYRIYALDLGDLAPFEPNPEIALRILEDAPDTVVLGAFIGDKRAAACWIWYGERYKRERNFWPLGPTEAKLVHIETNSDFRGRGIGTQLLAFAGTTMRDRGFTKLFARIWHNNTPSIRVFTKAGWRYEHFVLEMEPLRLGKRMRFTLKGRR